MTVNLTPLAIAILVLFMVALIKLIKGRYRPAILLAFIAVGLLGGLFLGGHRSTQTANRPARRLRESNAEWHAKQAELRALKRHVSKLQEHAARLGEQFEPTTQAGAETQTGVSASDEVVIKAECDAPVDFQDPEIEIQIGSNSITKEEARQVVREVVAEISANNDVRDLVSKGREIIDNARAIWSESSLTTIKLARLAPPIAVKPIHKMTC